MNVAAVAVAAMLTLLGVVIVFGIILLVRGVTRVAHQAKEDRNETNSNRY